MNRDRVIGLCAAGAVAWLVLVEVVGSLLPRDIFLDSLLGLCPLVACAVFPPRTTSLFGALAVGLTVWSGHVHGAWGTGQQWVRLADVVAVSVAAVVISSARVGRERKLARVSRIAEVAQRAVLPVVPPSVHGLSISTRYLSASEDSVVGGDLYDCSVTEGYIRFIVGDVRGKGLGAVEQAARVIRAFRQSAATKATLPEVVEDMDAYLQSFFSEEEFVTAVIIEATTPGVLTLANCGHQPALLLRADGTTELLEVPPALPLGLGSVATTESFTWKEGDRLLLYTDGLTEARNRDRDFFPLLEHTDALRSENVEEALDGLMQRLRQFVPGGQLNDDLAAMLMERVSSAATPSNDVAEEAAEPRTRALASSGKQPAAR